MTDRAQVPNHPLEAGGRQVAFYALGGRGPHAVMLHGFGSDRLSWGANQPALQSVATLFSLDLPGHGESGMDAGDGRVTTLADRVAGVLDRHGIRGATLIGHSLGGAIALVLAKKRPDLVASWIGIAPAGLGHGVDPVFLAEFSRLTTAEAAGALLETLFQRPALVGRPLVARVLEQLDKPGSRDALRLMGDGIATSVPDIEAAAAHAADVGLPRLVLWGEEDRINPPDLEKLRRSGMEAVIIPGAGHLPHVENPRLANASLVDFLSRGAAKP